MRRSFMQVRRLQGREIANGGHAVLRCGVTAFFVCANLAWGAEILSRMEIPCRGGLKQAPKKAL